LEEKLFNLMNKMYQDINDIKSHMATKDDIANMATKDDIANMATKDDIANMATKDDIANMATKDDIARIEIRIENEIIDKIRALNDSRMVQADINEMLLSSINRIEAKIDILQMETAHVRRIK